MGGYAMAVNLIVLAAGQGTRMNSDRPKVLHEIGGAPLVVHALRAGGALDPIRRVVVTGTGAQAVEAMLHAWDPEVRCVRQEPQLGTGHAVLQARAALADATGDAIVLYGDTPFLTAATLERMLEARKRHAIVVLGFEPADPARYGRLVTEGDILRRIVEWKDADAGTRAIGLVNSGVVCADLGLLMDLLSEVGNANAAGEYYLTDIVGIAAARGLTSGVVTCQPDETIGINTREDLVAAEALFQSRARREAIADGVTLVSPETVHFAHDTVIGRDAVVEPHVVFGPGVTVESGARIRAFSHLEGAHVSRGAIVGPFARLRPGAELAEDVHVGNFVEIKNAIVDEGAKINHLSYIGDAEIGARTNIGAGTVTCNYDGVFKHRTVIGKEVFVGSDTMLVAPVRVGDGAMTATGTVVTQDVPAGALAIGRVRAEIKPGFAARFLARLRALRGRATGP
jgi:bifunctional UDP-N-acetylglucosamine pyrophosphorylase/glucosamine-1-phosphate N-acetyltransferase